MELNDLYSIYRNSKGISIDSRKLESGMLFFALKGDNFDGNQFTEMALENGAEYCIIDDPSFDSCHKCILVEDVLTTLQDLAKYHRNQMQIPVIGITGSNGKTTTKELIVSVLSEKYNVGYTQGNLNNHIGVPLTLLSLSDETDIAVIEMGANHPGEIALLSAISRPDYGLITNIGHAHLEGFGSFEGVIKTKTELYDHIKSLGKKIFYNKGNQLLQGLVEEKQLETISYLVGKGEADYRAEIFEDSFYLGLKVGGHLTIQTKLIGAYNAENAMAAYAIGQYFGVDEKDIKTALEEYVPENNRSQYLETDQNRLLLDAYNANPTSMRLAIENFNQTNLKNKCLVLGDMLELGRYSHEAHREIFELVKRLDFDKVFLVGKEFEKIENDQNILCFPDVNRLKEYLQKNPLADKTILLKASRGVGLEKIVEEL